MSLESKFKVGDRVKGPMWLHHRLGTVISTRPARCWRDTPSTVVQWDNGKKSDIDDHNLELVSRKE